MATTEGQRIRTGAEAEDFARVWVAAWNALDAEAVLAHFGDGVRFTSPRALQRVGVATVEGKAALRDYWQQSLALVTSLMFELDHVVWDPERTEIAIVYTAAINDQRVRACEIIRFGDDGLALCGEALYGAAV